jgi:hypothetical protein
MDLPVRINDELKNTLCRKDDFENMSEFYNELIKDESAVFEYIKYRCVIFLSSIRGEVQPRSKKPDKNYAE